MPSFPLSDDDWKKIEHLFSQGPRNNLGRPRSDPRVIIDAIFWVKERQAKWHHLPLHYPPSQTCYIKWLEWEKTGLMSKVRQALEMDDSVVRK